MAKFEKQNAETAELFEEAIKFSECEKRKMFGYSVGFINGNMAAGVFADRIFFRVKRENQAEEKSNNKEITDFEPVAGRKMKDYLELKGTREHRDLIRAYIEKAIDITRQLPPK